MICSMTGFGQAQAEKGGERMVVTLKSLNHRYFETSFHLPVGFDHLEAYFRNKIRQNIKRGRVTISVSCINDSPEVVMLNQELVGKYFKVLEGMRKKLKLTEKIGIGGLVSLPGVLSYKKKELARGQKERLVRSALSEALKDLMEMRLKEGAVLGRELSDRIQRISRHMVNIKKSVRTATKANKKAMPIDAFESFLRSTDVSEEIARINFHLKSFSKHMKTREAKGKVLDFIGQELQREINTLGAKVQNKNAAYQVIMVKDQIEKIREQVQNIE